MGSVWVWVAGVVGGFGLGFARRRWAIVDFLATPCWALIVAAAVAVAIR